MKYVTMQIVLQQFLETSGGRERSVIITYTSISIHDVQSRSTGIRNHTRTSLKINGMNGAL